MRFKIERYSIRLEPECAQDVAFIEDTLGLKHNGDTTRLTRWNVHPNSTQIAAVETPVPGDPLLNDLDDITAQLYRASTLAGQDEDKRDPVSALRECLDELEKLRGRRDRVLPFREAADAILHSTCIDEHRYCPPFDMLRAAVHGVSLENVHAVEDHEGDASAALRGVRRASSSHGVINYDPPAATGSVEDGFVFKSLDTPALVRRGLGGFRGEGMVQSRAAEIADKKAMPAGAIASTHDEVILGGRTPGDPPRDSYEAAHDVIKHGPRHEQPLVARRGIELLGDDCPDCQHPTSKHGVKSTPGANGPVGCLVVIPNGMPDIPDPYCECHNYRPDPDDESIPF